jgi:hypothetical protein
MRFWDGVFVEGYRIDSTQNSLSGFARRVLAAVKRLSGQWELSRQRRHGSDALVQPIYDLPFALDQPLHMDVARPVNDGAVRSKTLRLTTTSIRPNSSA